MLEHTGRRTVVLCAPTNDAHPVAGRSKRLFSESFRIDDKYAHWLAFAEDSLEIQGNEEFMAGRRNGVWESTMSPDVARLIQEAQKRFEEEEGTFDSEPVDLASPVVEPFPEKISASISEKHDYDQEVQPWRDEPETDVQARTTNCTSCQSWFTTT